MPSGLNCGSQKRLMLGSLPTITSFTDGQLLLEDGEVGGERLSRLGRQRRHARAARIDGEVDPDA